MQALETNLNNYDIMSMFKDDGSGTIDATKVMVKALQEKVFKKFDLVETRNKKENAENFKTRNTVENLIQKFDKMSSDLENIQASNKEHMENFEAYKKENIELFRLLDALRFIKDIPATTPEEAADYGLIDSVVTSKK